MPKVLCFGRSQWINKGSLNKKRKFVFSKLWIYLWFWYIDYIWNEVISIIIKLVRVVIAKAWNWVMLFSWLIVVKIFLIILEKTGLSYQNKTALNVCEVIRLRRRLNQFLKNIVLKKLSSFITKVKIHEQLLQSKNQEYFLAVVNQAIVSIN